MNLTFFSSNFYFILFHCYRRPDSGGYTKSSVTTQSNFYRGKNIAVVRTYVDHSPVDNLRSTARKNLSMWFTCITNELHRYKQCTLCDDRFPYAVFSGFETNACPNSKTPFRTASDTDGKSFTIPIEWVSK